MPKVRNLKTEYEEVDSYITTVVRKSNCSICNVVLLKGQEIRKVHYCQLGGFLIQHKYMCQNHVVPYLYRAGVGFKFSKTQIDEKKEN